MREIPGYTEKEKVQNDHDEVLTKQYISENDYPKKSTEQNNEKPDNENMAKHNDYNVTHERNEEEDDEIKAEAPTKECFLYKIVYYMINRFRGRRHAKAGTSLFQVRWFGFKPGDDTWEPIIQLPRRKILYYFRSNKLPIPDKIDKANDG